MQYQKTPQGYMVRLQKGEEIHASLTHFMREMKIGGGSVVGIGAVHDVALGVLDVATKEYTRTEYPEVYELLNLTGNLSLVDGEPLLHAHVVISGHDLSALGGHLFEATVSVTGEFHIAVADTEFHRALDSEIGLKLLDLKESL